MKTELDETLFFQQVRADRNSMSKILRRDVEMSHRWRSRKSFSRGRNGHTRSSHDPHSVCSKS